MQSKNDQYYSKSKRYQSLLEKAMREIDFPSFNVRRISRGKLCLDDRRS